MLLKKNTLVFIRKNDLHYFEPSIDSGVSFINLAFTEEILNKLFDYLTPGFCSYELLSAPLPPTICILEHDANWIHKNIDELNAMSHKNTDLLKFKLKVILFKIFTQCFQNYVNLLSEETIEQPTWLTELDKKMHRIENFSQPTEHMIELSGKTRTHLNRVLKKYFNMTVSQYMHEIRLNYMANSLVTTDYPILDICLACGFENLSWAYELFKIKYHTTPLNYRNQNRL